MAFTEFGEGVATALFAPFVKDVLGGDDLAYGAIVSAQAIGGLLGGVAIGALGRGVPPGRLYGLGGLGFGLVALAMYHAHRAIPGVAPPLVLSLVAALPGAALGAGFTTLVQRLVADE